MGCIVVFPRSSANMRISFKNGEIFPGKGTLFIKDTKGGLAVFLMHFLALVVSLVHRSGYQSMRSSYKHWLKVETPEAKE